ncbi:Hypp6334 [Branchiostoma lanceolatum]|uniref:Hypp6334 protein n=1 Tax=Branchiostoma lanceolatum TaxID=7740 RepID=A0A8K0E394_BRALA|nr:Hypp6334 [Branchiostoma lanceolatum]
MFYHVKTTPLATICQAVRQSMSLPVVFRPYKYLHKPDMYIDGGVCANFPIYCYDGWWLSMDEQDTFDKRIEEEPDEARAKGYFYPEYSETRFQPFEVVSDEEQRKERRQKTLGLMLYSKTGRKAYQDIFIKRLEILENKGVNQRPSDTKLAKQFEEREKVREKRIAEHRQEMEKDLDSKKERLFKVLEAPRNRRDMLKLFTELFPEDELKDFHDGAKDHEVVFNILFAKYPGGPVTDGTIHSLYKNWEPLENGLRDAVSQRVIESPTELYLQYLDFVGTNKPIKREDVERSIAIDVDYVSTMDFNMEPADQTFLMRQGALATLAFLEEYVQKNRLKKRSS